MMRRCQAVIAALLLGAMAAPLAAKPPSNWQSTATAADRKRLARLWEAWTKSLAQIDAAGESAALAGLGPVAEADADTMNANAADRAAAPAKGPLPGAGAYNCRTIRLGQRSDAPPAPVVQAGPVVPCRIESRGSTLWFEQDAGANRLGGRLYPDGDRMVFLGSPALRGEMGMMAYGTDVERNVIGALRALGPQHWRLELPWPTWQSTLDLVDITPR